MPALKTVYDTVLFWTSFVINTVPDWFWCVTMGDCMLGSITFEQLQAKRKIFWFLVCVGLGISHTM